MHQARERLKQLKNIKLIEAEHYDRSKIVLSVKNLKNTNGEVLNGKRFQEMLRSYHLEMEMASGSYVIAMTGMMGVVLLSRELSRHCIAPVFAYIGDKTLYILVFHFLAFKLVSFSYIFANNLPIDYLTQFPVIQDANTYMWVI